MPHRRTSFAPCLIILLGTMLQPAPGRASGGHAPDGDAPAASGAKAPVPDDLTTCPKGQIWDKRHKRCAPLRKGALPDDETAGYAYALAKAGRYDEALTTLDLMNDSTTAEALNYRGYATRKLGRTDEGIAYYRAAITLDPSYPKVREYLGEAYVIKGRMDLADEQLTAIKAICGTTCEPYRDLAAAMGSPRAD